MKKSIWKSLPGVKTTLITIVVCLVLGALTVGGLHPRALLGLAFAAAFLMLITFRNHDPDGFQAWNDPQAYSLRMQRDKLFTSLKTLTEAVENSDTPDSTVATSAREARDVLYSLKPHTRAR
jgi:hypothetical protein